MSHKALDLVCRAADVPDALFTADEVAGWRRAAVQQLRALNVLRQADTATHVVCDACAERHVERVDRISCPDGVVRFYICCPEAGRVEVPPARLLQWALDYGALASHLATAAGTHGALACAVPDRVWRLGAVKLAGRSRSAFLVRGLLWPDATDVLAQARIRRDAVVLVTGVLSDDEFWDGRTPHVVALAEVARLDDDGLQVDLDHIESQIALRDETPRKKRHRKRSPRAGDIDRLTREMHRHLRDAKKRAFDTRDEPDGPKLLPRPSRKQLAGLCGMSEPTVSRCFSDKSAKLLRILWDQANTVEGVMAYRVK